MAHENESTKFIRYTSLVLLGFNELAILGALIGTLWFNAAFTEMFAEMRLQKMPVLTMTILSIPSWGYVLIFISLGVGLIAKERLALGKTVLILNLLATFGLIAYVSVYTTALILPIIEVMDRL